VHCSSKKCFFITGERLDFLFRQHLLDGKTLKIGGPGYVGTFPEYRDKGIGLTMVKKATQILKDEAYDYSYYPLYLCGTVVCKAWV